MSHRAVYWHEGMFLRPHHLQAAERYSYHLAQRSEKWDLNYDWGLRAIDLDRDALANHRLVVRKLQARLRDGTLVAIPEDGVLDPVDLKGAFERAGSVMVYLAVPLVRPGSANVSANGEAEGTRYMLETQELEDENTGLNPQFIQMRLLNLKLLVSTEDHAGYEVLPIAQIEKAATADALPQLDITYIPPVLACDAWQPLLADILQGIYDRLGKKIDLLAQQVVSSGITFDSQAQGDAAILSQLRVLNEAYALLGIEAFVQGVHPLAMYLELCRLVGQLAIFGDTRRPPDLPKYDHDDLGGCFYRVKQYIDTLLNVVDEPKYKERPFIGAGLRMQVALEPAWLEPIWQVFVGVQSKLSAKECDRKLKELDMKIASSQRVDEIFRLGKAGLKFTLCPQPPQVLRSMPGLTYFQVDRTSQPEEWQSVQKELTLAIRLNETLIDGSIQGQRILTIRDGVQKIPMQFTLYVLPGEKK